MSKANDTSPGSVVAIDVILTNGGIYMEMRGSNYNTSKPLQLNLSIMRIPNYKEDFNRNQKFEKWVNDLHSWVKGNSSNMVSLNLEVEPSCRDYQQIFANSEPLSKLMSICQVKEVSCTLD